MREVHVDLSNDECSSIVFGGYIGEHNETKVVVKLPDRMLTDDITKYQFVFKSFENKLHLDNIVDLSDINNGNISSILTKSQTVGKSLILCITAIVEENNKLIRKAKTPIIFLRVRDNI